ncbi:MAG TPA: PQQ-binding-like beta-propeller repeat protein, partial [Steroidobacter sp.]|nr:PQQ-binding-like beta-propeller repeat protein [Steroidobacter sp.]
MRNRGSRFIFGATALGIAVLIGSTSLRADSDNKVGEWRFYGGTLGAQKYAPLDQINASNVDKLKIVWRQSASPPEVLGNDKPLVGSNYEHTPLMVNGLLYMRSDAGPVMALDPQTGKVLWTDKQAATGGGKSRGISYWSDGKDARIFALDGSNLVAVNAKTGERYRDFGKGGHVDLNVYADSLPNAPVENYSWSSFPVVVRDVVVLAGVPRVAEKKVPEGTQAALDPPGDIRGYDVRTGKLLWTFHVVPRKGEFGYDTWKQGSAELNGLAGAWTWLTGDNELGYIYIPTEAPSNDFYGGNRQGDNLFGNSVLCLDARTGKRVWHFQTIHHDLWDFDLPVPPVLMDINVDGKRIKALAQLSKQAYVYVLDRVTGKPVWPIVERPMPKGDVPGEYYSPTQPIPTRPAPIELQQLTESDLIDFTPELRAQALEIFRKYESVPVFTPAKVGREIIMLPGTTGAANWNGAGFDPDTGMLYVPVIRNAVRTMLEEKKNSPYPYDRKAESMMTTNLELPYMDVNPSRPLADGAPSRLPITKPPYGSIVALDMNKGEILWRVANGDGPRNHPLLKDLNLPPLGTQNRASPLVTKSLLFIGEG